MPGREDQGGPGHGQQGPGARCDLRYGVLRERSREGRRLSRPAALVPLHQEPQQVAPHEQLLEQGDHGGAGQEPERERRGLPRIGRLGRERQ